MIRTIALISTLAVAGCGGGIGLGGGGSSSAPPSGAKDTCNAAAYADFIGQDSVVTLSIPEPKRSYRTDEAVPSVFDASRVSIVLDETDTIIQITCG